jgi:hypothetical protein
MVNPLNAVYHKIRTNIYQEKKMSEKKSIRSSADYKAPQVAITEHTLSLTTAADEGAGKTISYTANAEWIILRKKEKPVAEMFHVAYLANGEAADKRPITTVSFLLQCYNPVYEYRDQCSLLS